MGGEAVLGPGRQLPGWEEGDVGLQACVLLPAERLKASPCSCLSIRLVLHEMRGSVGALETGKWEASCSPGRPLQRALWTHLGKFGAQPVDSTLELQCPASSPLFDSLIQGRARTSTPISPLVTETILGSRSVWHFKN